MQTKVNPMSHRNVSQAMPPPDHSKDEPLHIIGTTLEGGGQLVRVSVCLASILREPIHITHIRGNRLGKQGLKGSHLEALEFLQQMTGADVNGARIGSKEIWFTLPLMNPNETGNEINTQGKMRWEGDERWVSLKQKKPGSIFLILQAVLPYLLWMLPTSDTKTNSPTIHLNITGGTNVPLAPSADYITQVLIPTLIRIGLPEIKLDLHSRGWTHGPIQIGEVDLHITPLALNATLPSFQLTKRSDIVGFDITMLASPSAVRETICERTIKALKKEYRNSVKSENIAVVTDADSGHPKRLYLLVVARCASGERLGADWLFDEKINLSSPSQPSMGNASQGQRSAHTKNFASSKADNRSNRGKRGRDRDDDQDMDSAAVSALADRLIDRVLSDLSNELERGGAVDKHMADQLVVFQALAEKGSVVQTASPSPSRKQGQNDDGNINEDIGIGIDIDEGSSEDDDANGTLHTRTVRWVVERFLTKGGASDPEDSTSESRSPSHFSKQAKIEMTVPRKIFSTRNGRSIAINGIGLKAGEDFHTRARGGDYDNGESRTKAAVGYGEEEEIVDKMKMSDIVNTAELDVDGGRGNAAPAEVHTAKSNGVEEELDIAVQRLHI